MKKHFEVVEGFEPTIKGFADLRLRPLSHTTATNNTKQFKEPFVQGDGLEPTTSFVSETRSNQLN